jgi:lysozyme
MSRILPPARPHRDRSRLERVLASAKMKPALPVLVFVRGHYLNSMGADSVNDYNIYDDSCYLISQDFQIFESYNANTDPSFVRRGGRTLAKVNLGVYRFYKGKHKGQYNALRAFPEGVRIPCTRDGKASTAQYINIHKGGTSVRGLSVTFSEGCLTIPDTQYGDFIARVYEAMDRAKVETISVILIENKQTPIGQRWFGGGDSPIA